MTKVCRRQLKYVGHVIRENGVEWDCLVGMVEVRICRRRQRLSLGSDTNFRSTEQVAKRAEDSTEWRSVIAYVNTALRYDKVSVPRLIW